MLANWSGVWKWLHDGCEFRRVDEEIARAGFREIDISSFTLDNEVDTNDDTGRLMHMISPHIVGVAIK